MSAQEILETPHFELLCECIAAHVFQCARFINAIRVTITIIMTMYFLPQSHGNT